jgi:hypothetical protein
MNFIGFKLNVPFYLLRSLYKMSKRYTIQSLNSSLFHHGLIKMLLIHRLTTVGDCWDGILTRNGFPTIVLVETLISGEPLIRKQFDIPNNKADSLNRNPRDKAMLGQFSHEQQVVGFEFSEPPMHELDVGHNTTVKSDIKKYCNQKKQKHMALGFQRKRFGHLISRKLRNRTRPHLSSIGLIKINEVSNSEIEDFLVVEDPYCQGFGPVEPYDFVTNLPPCLQDKKGFFGNYFGHGKMAGKSDMAMRDRTLHQQVVHSVQCESCLH